jgi:hypothetical protein
MAALVLPTIETQVDKDDEASRAYGVNNQGFGHSGIQYIRWYKELDLV